jgi:N-acetylglucosamine-6-phosphate deacetylase
VAEFARRGAVVAIGHTDADYPALERAVEAGARHMTHFCNAMRPLHHRDPGPIGFGLLHDDVTVDVVADLRHLDAAMLRLIWKTKGAGRVALVSDAMPAAGLGDGRHDYWGEAIMVAGGVARNAAGTIAGSVSLLDEGVRNLRAILGADVPPAAARAAASEVPRRILGA